MPTTKRRYSAKPRPTNSPRASVTFPEELYAELERIAVDRKVSVAWVVRDAVEKYIADLYPLFHGSKTTGKPQ
jgi:metal-responsive CopG/Arc/MetJ family transcriptional regulator